MKVIGITGSIGSGKSYGMQIFKKICEKKQINALFLDIDIIRREILQEYPIDVNILNKKIYSNPDEMKIYKNFIVPKIKSYIENCIYNFNGYIFIEWALLIEDKLDAITDYIILFSCTQELQIYRLANSNLKMSNILERINNQLSNKDKEYYLDNKNIKFSLIYTDKKPDDAIYIETLERIMNNV